jgi:hypothetical protein
MAETPRMDHPPAGWLVLDVMKAADGSTRNWVALMIVIDPDDIESCRGMGQRARECWVRIAGKHRTRRSAYGALDEMMATRH